VWFLNLLWPFILLGLIFSNMAWRIYIGVRNTVHLHTYTCAHARTPVQLTSLTPPPQGHKRSIGLADDVLGNLQRVHGLFGAILSLTIVFRTNAGLSVCGCVYRMDCEGRGGA
jgi:hypothetical protein